MTRRTFSGGAAAAAAYGQSAQPTKIKDLRIYAHERYYVAFPSVVRRPDGELLVAFRRAPNRRLLNLAVTHTDANSQLVLVRSRDAGETWSREPELIYAHPWGGAQDPCMVQLRDGSIVCASYLWTPGPEGPAAKNKYLFQGGFVLRSTDGARTWQGPHYPPPVPGRTAKDAFGQPLPAYNRGAMCQGRDGRLYWAVAYAQAEGVQQTDIHLMISADGGVTWSYSCPIATDAKVVFNETSLYETPKGDLVAFVRTAGLEDQTVVVRSRNGGKSFEPWQQAGWQGHPHHAVRLADQRVFLVYGYRHKPYGVRARVLDAECSNFATAPEMVLRDDGGGGDLGYPWAVVLPGRRVLVTYYFQQNDGLREIAATLVSV